MTTTDKSADVLALSQAAREAAADYLRAVGDPEFAEGFLTGENDKTRLAQALARFERAIRTESADDALLREALEDGRLHVAADIEAQEQTEAPSESLLRLFKARLARIDKALSSTPRPR